MAKLIYHNFLILQYSDSEIHYVIIHYVFNYVISRYF